MAVITRIEIVNYLCEGWQPSMGHARWSPLWPANTLVLGGLSTAIQVPNGGGKTSVTNAILFVLSRDRELKNEFLIRCAPMEAGYSHVRIEFAILDEELSQQRILIGPDAMESSSKRYVIGVCANRGDEDLLFYRYAGTLETAPAYRMEGSKIAFTPNDEFRRQVAKSDWHRGTIADWRKVVSEFMSPEVVRQNVQFHRSGAGDASATFKKVVTQSGERFDEAYFRTVAAPQLLANLMGDSAEEGERAIEDTITISMTRFIDAKLEVERKQSYLQHRQAMEEEFAPVLDAAMAIQEAEHSYQKQLQALARDAAFFEYFAAQGDTALPGIPRDVSLPQVSQEVTQCLAGMALDKDGSIVIADSAIAQIVGKSTGHLNQAADRRSINRGPLTAHPTSSQVIDFNCDIKIFEGSGGRQKKTRYYDQDGARELVARCIGNGIDKSAILDAAFDVAAQRLDTNPFRQEQLRLGKRIAELKAEILAASAEGDAAEKRRLELERQITQRAENHAAYQDFCAKSALLPESLRSSPLEAKEWVAAETTRRDSAHLEHVQRVAALTEKWESFLNWKQALGLQSPTDRLAELSAQKNELRQAVAQAQIVCNSKHANTLKVTQELSEFRAELSALQHQQAMLSPLIKLDQQFHQLFGDVDPLVVSPPVDKRIQLQARIRPKTEELEQKKSLHQQLCALGKEYRQFIALFGERNPLDLRPKDDWAKLMQLKNNEERILLTHKPQADALSKHLREYGISPSEWLRDTDEKRAAAEREHHTALLDIKRLEHELDTLDDLSLIHDARFEQALGNLQSAGIEYEPLRKVILELGSSKERCQALLSAFGSILEAPVIDGIEMVQQALATLQSADNDIPIIIRQPLLEAIHSTGTITPNSGGAVAFIAGATTRRIQALIDPEALERIKWEIQQKLTQIRSICDAAASRITECNPQRSEYRQALLAQTAVQNDAVAMVDAADRKLKELESKITIAEQLITESALQTLARAADYVRHGADNARDTTEQEIAELLTDLESLDSQIKELEILTSREAIQAHDGAAQLARLGGLKRIDEIQTDIERLRNEVKHRHDVLKQLEDERADSDQAFMELSLQHQNFQDKIEPQMADLRKVIDFEAEGHAHFMERKDETKQQLKDDLEALRPLAQVSFERAQSFQDHQNDDETALQKQIAEAVESRAKAVNTAQRAQRDLERMDALLGTARRNAEALHELAHFLIEKRKLIVPFLADLSQREGGATPAAAHDLYKNAEDLKFDLMDWQHDKGPFDPMRLTALRTEIEEVDVVQSGAAVRDAKRCVERARMDFQSRRSSFCAKATNSEDNALSQAEIEAIQAANSIEQLQALARLGDRLRQDLALEQSELEELQEAASTVETESIATLSRLVESCRMNLKTMNDVMARNPNARFFVEATIISDEDILKLMKKLRDGIEARKRDATTKSIFGKRDSDDQSIRNDVRRALIDGIFAEPSVQFRHVGMWGGKTQPIQKSLSEGQKAALQMMWLIKESEYHLECAVRRHLGGGAKKRLRDRSQRILFFDGLFSNLTDRALIDEAFKGLGEANSNLQLIGLIHNPEYRNNARIFPSLIIGRRAGWRSVEGERSFIRFEDGRPDGTIGFATFIKMSAHSNQNEVRHE
ncbi:hypothetical protein [Permianibacter aggregans]|uniref:Chromosome segregation ATPase n=1 Tax=Permianibacter aggregans TaxID=1510150 RepID=A0A4R6UMJ8_9GAMM|nr:hypothetical protein [Permianibacter aggregans]QGX40166.1 hypothetical protein E2H98_10985 [Permianibacter aggregans]TDQ47416.1 chromosome segregation ATPase [Permianibacter aggregans]